jgi:putative SOS response-associated peptidase YedK
MCYNYNLKKEKKEVENYYNASFYYDEDDEPIFDVMANGFTHLKMPVITNDTPDKIQHFNWGLIPFFAKDETNAKQLAKMCLNAMSETIHEKPSFRDSAKNKRCLIPATSFIEWQWTDLNNPKCKKIKYEIGLQNKLFSFAGLWSDWTNKATGEVISTFSIVTAPANNLMKEIHNNKKRMPFILRPDQEKDWLSGGNLEVENNLPLMAIAV